ncbi:MAG: MotA/TolQ/ExbB proton channel family protein [Burkholderiaceae bacterium]
MVALCLLMCAGAALAQAQPAAVPAVAVQAAGAAADNPYGLAALWTGSDWVARAVLLILVIMSVGSWYLIVVKYIEQSRMGRQARQTSDTFWGAGSIREGAGKLDANSPYRFIAEAGAEAAASHQGLRRHIPRDEWLQMSIQSAVDRVQARSQNGLAFLATVGSTSPFVGLFGTVWGIYHALTAIGISGQASIDKVAGPVGEALIMTAIGLAVAIPAVLGYNWLAKRNKAVMDEVREFSEELNGVLVGSGGQAA